MKRNLTVAIIVFTAIQTATGQLVDSRWTRAIPDNRRDALEARINEFVRAEKDGDWGRVFDLRVPSLVWSRTETRDDYIRRRQRRADGCEDGMLQSWSVIERMTEPSGHTQQLSGWAVYKCGDRSWKQLMVITAEWANGTWYVSLASANPVRV